MTDSLRDRIAWLLWCANEGYLTDDDRAGVSNIFTADPSALHPDDAFSLPHWRGMADAVIAELGLTKIEMLARSWHANYDAIPANDPRNPTDADIAYDDAGFQILHALGLEAE